MGLQHGMGDEVDQMPCWAPPYPECSEAGMPHHGPQSHPSHCGFTSLILSGDYMPPLPFTHVAPPSGVQVPARPPHPNNIVSCCPELLLLG